MSRVIGVTAGKKTTSADFEWQKVPHMSVTIGGLTFDAPVAVEFSYGKTARLITGCERDEHGYLYALPGGGRINSLGTIL